MPTTTSILRMIHAQLVVAMEHQTGAPELRNGVALNDDRVRTSRAAHSARVFAPACADRVMPAQEHLAFLKCAELVREEDVRAVPKVVVSFCRW